MSAVDVLAVLARKRSPFRDAGMRRAYDGCVEAYRAKGAGYLVEGNSGAAMFRRGFTGAHVGAWDAASRKTFSYAQFRAGQDCAQEEARAAVAELIADRDRLANIVRSHEAQILRMTDERAELVDRLENTLAAFENVMAHHAVNMPVSDVASRSITMEEARTTLARVGGGK